MVIQFEDDKLTKEESQPARIRPWAHKIVERVSEDRANKLNQLEKQKKLTDGEELAKIESKIANIKTSYVDIISELILIGSSNLIDSGLEYYVEGDKATLTYGD